MIISTVIQLIEELQKHPPENDILLSGITLVGGYPPKEQHSYLNIRSVGSKDKKAVTTIHLHYD
jgi:hypothetical protein